MRVGISWLLSAILLLSATTTTAQSFPCSKVAPEVRESVRQAGACRDSAPGAVTPKATPPASSTVTMRLSDGTVVRVPREISPGVGDGRKSPATKQAAPRTTPSKQSRTQASRSPPPAPQKLKVPDVSGRSYADAGGALADFKINRVETASAAPRDEVLSQEPAPGALVLRGSTVRLRVSDGSLARDVGTSPVAAPATEAASSTPGPVADSAGATTAAPVPDTAPASASTPAPTTAPAPTSAPAPAVAAAAAPAGPVPPALRDRLPTTFSISSPFVLGAIVLLGLLFGALFLRRWFGRREPLVELRFEPLAPVQHQQPVMARAGGVSAISENRAAPEIRFAARHEPGQARIVLVPPPERDEVAVEHSSHHHA